MGRNAVFVVVVAPDFLAVAVLVSVVAVVLVSVVAVALVSVVAVVLAFVVAVVLVFVVHVFVADSALVAQIFVVVADCL